MKIALLLGSVREDRKSDRVAYHLLRLLEGHPGIDATLLDLVEYPAPILITRWKKDQTPHPALPALSQHLMEANGLIFISPEYHGSYTGVLKNAIDHFWEEFKRKPIGVVATGSGRFGGINGSTEMQQLVLSLGAFPMPKKLIVPFIQEAYDLNGIPQDARTDQEARSFVEDFLWFATALHTAKIQQIQGRHS